VGKRINEIDGPFSSFSSFRRTPRGERSHFSPFLPLHYFFLSDSGNDGGGIFFFSFPLSLSQEKMESFPPLSCDISGRADHKQKGEEDRFFFPPPFPSFSSEVKGGW